MAHLLNSLVKWLFKLRAVKRVRIVQTKLNKMFETYSSPMRGLFMLNVIHIYLNSFFLQSFWGSGSVKPNNIFKSSMSASFTFSFKVCKSNFLL